MRKVHWACASLALAAALAPMVHAQDLSDLIKVKPGRSLRATGFLPADPAKYSALNDAPRTRGVLPPSKDLSSRFPKPYDQGDQNSCSAWAVGYAARSYYVGKETGAGFERFENIASPAYIYNTLNQTGNCKVQVSIYSALELLQNQGGVPLTAMGYNPDDCRTQIAAPVLAAHAQRFRVQRFEKVEPDVLLIKGQISRDNPVIAGLHLTDEIWSHEKVEKFTSTRRNGLTHAVVITGYDDARQAFKFVNSWGDDWQQGGFAWLDYKAAMALWQEGYVMTVGAAQAAAPQPTVVAAPQRPLAVAPPVVAPPRAATATDSLHNRAPGSAFRDCENCPEMVAIPAGDFMMGSNMLESNRLSGEGPQFRVVFPRNFAVGKFEVTFEEWDACVRERGCTHNPADEGWGRGRRPVVNVSWADAKQYTQWLSAKTGRNYRLLTESEWEYAARSGTSTPFSTGATITPAQANYNATYTYAGGVSGVPRNQTVPVGEFPANSYGLHDMHGNVYEWTEDCNTPNYQEVAGDGLAANRGDCSMRIMRGGAWVTMPRDLRSAARGRLGSALRYNYIGLRVARTD